MHRPDDEVTSIPSTADLLSTAAYAGGNRVAQLRDLCVLIGDQHGPVPSRNARLVCSSCREPGGGKHPFPCSTWVGAARIMGWKFPRHLVDRSGAAVPADLIADDEPAAVTGGETR
ncbi:hypothetical protein [Saccharothrix hoggarensis]|uniref:Uncharacterized protein n=1 Tax=Saccharothrix hoggarensis TaxID=913853 RepID=A0ABW3QKM8_9PSEU